MNYTNIFKLAEQFEKLAQQLTDEAIKAVIIDAYNELSVAPPNDVRIQHQGNNVIIWSNSYLDPPADSTIQDRLHQAFDPQEELYNFYVKFFE